MELLYGFSGKVIITFFFSFLPDTELESILKKHFVSVSYFKGTVLSGEDCRRVKVSLPLPSFTFGLLHSI